MGLCVSRLDGRLVWQSIWLSGRWIIFFLYIPGNLSSEGPELKYLDVRSLVVLILLLLVVQVPCLIWVRYNFQFQAAKLFQGV